MDDVLWDVVICIAFDAVKLPTLCHLQYQNPLFTQTHKQQAQEGMRMSHVLNAYIHIYVFVLIITYLFMFVDRHECTHFTYIHFIKL